MKVTPDPGAAAWIDGLRGEGSDFDWDRGNRTKNAKHGVTAEDVESILQGSYYFAGRILEPAHKEERWLVLGRDRKRRGLALVLTRRGNRIRAISCRAMRKKEKAVYEEAVRDQAEGTSRA